jgi:Polysaccharide pyruvyl transferase
MMGVSTNKLLRRLKYDIWPSRSIEYIGCPAPNLGDQAVFLAVSRTFRDVTVAYPKHPGGRVGRALRQWENQQKRLGTMLGGGTMIGAAAWSVGFAKSYEESLELSGLGFAFGTGVAENHFPADNEFLVSDPSNYYRWANLLKQSRYVGVRGPRSQASLAELGVTSEVLGDTACALVAPDGFWQPQSGRLGLNVGHGGGSMWGERARFNAAMGRFVAIATKQGWKIDFFALMDDDIDIIKEVARMGGIANPRIFCEYSDPDRYMARVRKMRAFIGMKLHSVILAMCAHVPSIMLEYRPKGLDFMASVGLEQFNVRTSDVEPRALFDMLFQLVDHGTQFSEIIRTRLTEYKQLQESRARELIAMAEQITSRRATAS